MRLDERDRVKEINKLKSEHVVLQETMRLLRRYKKDAKDKKLIDGEIEVLQTRVDFVMKELKVMEII